MGSGFKADHAHIAGSANTWRRIASDVLGAEAGIAGAGRPACGDAGLESELGRVLDEFDTALGHLSGNFARDGEALTATSQVYERTEADIAAKINALIHEVA